MLNIPAREVLVFGAAGGTGAAIVRALLTRDFGITAFVRNTEHARHVFNGQCSRVDFFAGDAMDMAAVNRAVRSDIDAVVVSLGIFQPRAGGDDLARATANIIAAMRAAGPRRLVCISSLGVGDSRLQGNFIARLMQRTTLRHTLADKELQEQAIRKSGLDWTIVRPSRLVNANGPPYVCRWSGAQPQEKLVWAIDRAQVADIVLECLDDKGSINQAINITGSLTRQ